MLGTIVGHRENGRLVALLKNSTALTRLAAGANPPAGLLLGVLAAPLLVATLGVSPGVAETFNGTGQAGFDTYIPQATQPGNDDIVNITIGTTSGNVVVDENLALPGAADGIELNFIADAVGPARFGVVNGAELTIGAGTNIDFNNKGRFDVGYGADVEGSVVMTGGSITLGTAGPNYSALNVGFTGTGSFTQSGGDIELDGSAFQIGVDGGTGAYEMSGGTFNLTPGSTIYVGEGAAGDGTLTITGNAQFTTPDVASGSGTQLFIGTNGGTGRIIQDGAGSLVSIDSGSNAFWFGWDETGNGGAPGGNGSYDLRAGTFEVLSSQGVTFGRDANTTGSFIQSGGTFRSEGAVVIGRAGTGSYTLSGGSATFNDGLDIATLTGSGEVVQTGGSANVTGGIAFGTGAGTGSYTLGGGTLTVDAITGGNANSEFIFDGGTLIAGGSFTTSANFATSFESASTIEVDGSDVLTWNSAISGDGGLTKTGTGTLALGADNSGYTGDVGLQGGTLALTNAKGLTAGSDVAMSTGTTLDLTGLANGNSGGIVQIGALSGSGTVQLGDSYLVSTINGQAAFSGTIVSDAYGYQSGVVYGRFYKDGTGDLLINGSTMQKGEAYIVGGGSMTQSAGTTKWANINVGSGAGQTGTLNVSGGELQLDTGLRVGDFGGTGYVQQTGGTVRLVPTCDTEGSCSSLNIGNQGGTGTYNISGDGKLILEGGSHSIGRNAGNNSGGSGELNISGNALVELSKSTTTTGFIVIGDRDPNNPGKVHANGTVNQTGGTFRILDGARLYLGGYGESAYNLDGGTLEIGGESLLGQYSGSGPDHYDFNLGGGTIKVIGTALNTSVDAELTGSSVSTIDTNGIGATWNGTLSGTGGLRKSGAGELALTGPNSYSGNTYLAGGTLRAAEGALGAGSSIIFEASSTLAFGDADGTTLGKAVQINTGATASFEIGTGATGTLSGQITGAGGLTKTGTGTLVLTREDNEAANTYSGATFIDAGVLRIEGTNALSVNTQVTVDTDGTFELVGVTQDVDSLEGDGNVSIGEGSTLTVGALSGSASITLGEGSELNVGGNGDDSSFSGTLAGEGTFVKTGTGALVITEDTDASAFTGPTQINGGALVVNGSLAGSDVTVGVGGVLGGDGTVKSVTLQSGATVGPGNSPGTLTVGEFAFEDGSIYAAQFGFDGNTPVSDNILVTLLPDTSGNAVIENGAILNLDVSEGIRIGHDYEIITVETAGAVVREGGTAVFDVEYDAPLLQADVDYSDPKAVTVTFSGIDAPWSTQVSTRNQGATANAVQSMNPANPLYEAAVILGEDEIDRAFDLLAGDINASAKGVLINDSQFLRGAIFDRLRTAENGRLAGGMSVAPLGYATPAKAPAPFPVKAAEPVAPVPASALWAQGFGSWGSTSGDGNAASLDRNTGGFFIGGDTLVSGWRLGVVGGYSSTSFDADGNASSGDSDNYHLGVYAGTSWDAVNFRVGAAYSWNDVSTTRYVSIPYAQTLKADYDAGTTQVFGELGYGIGANGFDFEPFVGLAYVSLDTDGFTESGGPAALSSSSSTTDVTYTTLGLRGSTSFDLGGTLATAKGMLGWRHAFGDVTPLSTYAFAAGSDFFTIAGLPIAEDAFLVDVGLDVAVSTNVTLGVAYGGQFGDGAQDQSVRGTLDWKF